MNIEREDRTVVPGARQAALNGEHTTLTGSRNFHSLRWGIPVPAGAELDLEPNGAVEPLARAGPDFDTPVPPGEIIP